MPPPETQKVTIRIKKRFTDESGGRLYGPGDWPVDPATAARLIEQGRAARIGGAPVAKAPVKPPVKPPTNPRIPETKQVEDEVTDTPLPDDFPSREALAAAGFDSIEKLKAPDIKEALESVEGLTPADITKIGLAISKI